MRDSRRLIRRIPWSQEYQNWKRHYDAVIHLDNEEVSILLYPDKRVSIGDILANLGFGGLEKFGGDINAETSLESIIKHDDHVEVRIGKITGSHPVDDYEADKIERAVETYREIMGIKR